jgi:uncharacterized protein (TIGR02453 family)
MLQKSTIQFLKDLKRNNNKEWFDTNRKKYEGAKSDYELLAGEVIKQLGRADESVAHLEPKQCMFRINRDIRFSKDKAPYKTNMGMYLSKGGKKSAYAGYYFHLEPGGSFAAAGLWMPSPPDLKKVRQEIDYNWDEFKKIIQAKKFKSVFRDLERSGETVLSRAPKGYEEDNPAIEYLKFKSFIATAKIMDEDLVAKALVKKITDHFIVAKPLIDFCNQALDE